MFRPPRLRHQWLIRFRRLEASLPPPALYESVFCLHPSNETHMAWLHSITAATLRLQMFYWNGRVAPDAQERCLNHFVALAERCPYGCDVHGPERTYWLATVIHQSILQANTLMPLLREEAAIDIQRHFRCAHAFRFHGGP